MPEIFITKEIIRNPLIKKIIQEKPFVYSKIQKPLIYSIITFQFQLVNNNITEFYVGGHSRNRVYNNMVPNPIYAGPVYDVVEPQFESVSKPSSTQAMATSPDSLDANDRDEEHLHLTNLKSKPLSSNIYESPGASII